MKPHRATAAATSVTSFDSEPWAARVTQGGLTLIAPIPIVVMLA
jgi:uncharacterized membrane protein